MSSMPKTYKYKYTGEDPVFLPEQGKLVEPSEKFEAERKIDHPLFEHIKEEEPKKAK
jgi:hypothetical protein